MQQSKVGAPWVGINKDILVGPEVEEAPLPIAPRPSLPVVPSPEIVAKTVLTLNEVIKMKVVDLKTGTGEETSITSEFFEGEWKKSCWR